MAVPPGWGVETLKSSPPQPGATPSGGWGGAVGAVRLDLCPWKADQPRSQSACPGSVGSLPATPSSVHSPTEVVGS